MGERSVQMVNLTPTFRPSRQINSHLWLRDNPAETKRNSSGGVVCSSTSIIAPDLLRSHTRQSRLSCEAPKIICPVFKAGLRGSSLKSSAIGRLRATEDQIIASVVKSNFVFIVDFAAIHALDIAGAA